MALELRTTQGLPEETHPARPYISQEPELEATPTAPDTAQPHADSFKTLAQFAGLAQKLRTTEELGFPNGPKLAYEEVVKRSLASYREAQARGEFLASKRESRDNTPPTQKPRNTGNLYASDVTQGWAAMRTVQSELIKDQKANRTRRENIYSRIGYLAGSALIITGSTILATQFLSHH
jgi:hypothetical protein